MKNKNPAHGNFQFLPFLLSLLITLSIGFCASMLTRPEIAGWFSTLNKPAFNPPSWVFAPVWTILYILIGTAAYLVWKHRDHTATYLNTGIGYILQLLLNFSWSMIFFGLHQILAALVVIVFLWFGIMVNIFYFNKFSKLAAWLLVPYLLWVSFASLLNLYFYLLNS